MGLLLRMQTRLHFKDCRKMSRLSPSVTSEKQYLQKIALRAENPSGPKLNSLTLRIEQISQIICSAEQKIC